MSIRYLGLHLGFLLATLCCISACGVSKSSPTIVVPTASQVAQFEKTTGLTLPTSASAVKYSEDSGLDDAMWLEVKVPKEKFSDLIPNGMTQGGNWHALDGYILPLFDRFWSSPPKSFRSMQVTLPHGRALNILVDETGPTELIVYLMWHTT